MARGVIFEQIAKRRETAMDIELARGFFISLPNPHDDQGHEHTTLRRSEPDFTVAKEGLQRSKPNFFAFFGGLRYQFPPCWHCPNPPISTPSPDSLVPRLLGLTWPHPNLAPQPGGADMNALFEEFRQLIGHPWPLGSKSPPPPELSPQPVGADMSQDQ